MSKPLPLIRSMSWLHAWAGLIFGWLLFAIFTTGTLAVFDDELDRWMRPELAATGPFDADRVTARLLEELPPTPRWIITLPDARRPQASVGWFQDGSFRLRLIDPATGAELTPRETIGGDFFFRLHYRLYLPGGFGKWVVGAAAMAMLVTLAAGVLIHKRIFKDVFTFRPASSPRRAWLDGHLLTGVLFLPFHLMITYTGLAILYDTYMPAAVDRLYDGSRGSFLAELAPEPPTRPAAGRPAPPALLEPMLDSLRRPDGSQGVRVIIIDHPGDAAALVQLHDAWDRRLVRIAQVTRFDGVTGIRLSGPEDLRPAHHVQGAMIGLHRVSFADPWIRWFYFAAGAAGSAMIATGLVLFTSRPRKDGDRFPDRVARANVGAVAGLLLACIALLWANRLLPADMPLRAPAELGCFLAVWIAAILHGFTVPPGRGWPVQCGLSALLCIALPVLDLGSSGNYALDGWRTGDAVVIGVHLSAIIAGLGLGLISLRLRRRLRKEAT